MDVEYVCPTTAAKMSLRWMPIEVCEAVTNNEDEVGYNCQSQQKVKLVELTALAISSKRWMPPPSLALVEAIAYMETWVSMGTGIELLLVCYQVSNCNN